MSDLTIQSWFDVNQRFLAAALDWQRLLLEQRLVAAQTQPPVVQSADAPPAQAASWWRGFGRAPEPAAVPALLTAASPEEMSDDHVRRAAERMVEAALIDPPPALYQLSEVFGLTPFEQHVLLLCAAAELDPHIGGLLARAHGQESRRYPTLALALALFKEHNPTWDVLLPQRPLRRWRLIEISQPAGEPLLTSILRPDERVVSYLYGIDQIDDRLEPLLAPFDVDPDDLALPPSQEELAWSIVQQLSQRRPRPTVVQLVGADAASKQLIALRVAELGDRLIRRLPAELLPSSGPELETVARFWQREQLLGRVALYLDAHDLDRSAAVEGPASAISRFLAHNAGLVFLDTREIWPNFGPDTIVADVSRPTPHEQRAAWAAELGPSGWASAEVLAGQFNLNVPAIRAIACGALDVEASDAGPLTERVWDACLVRTRPRLDALAQRIEPLATWKQIVLPAAETELLLQIAGQVRQRATVYDDWGYRRVMSRGLGISVLFAGESGAGKTMAAEVLANELRLDLYRIDLSAVVSKYIGETEKNLRRLFDAAEDGGAILFFDEADALFGKRSEVKDSHDRYANIEVNYLLQRMESYGGLAILATNMKSALDRAFLRRLRFIVRFPFPSVDDRRRIWQKAFPKHDPASGLAGVPAALEEADYARLAKLELTGGNIHSIALSAAFLAASAGSPVTIDCVLEAARAEFRKLELPLAPELRMSAEKVAL